MPHRIPDQKRADLRTAYERGVPVGVLARLAGVSQRAIRHRAAKGGWVRRPLVDVPPEGAAIDREAAVARLWAALETQLADLDGAEEARIASLAQTLGKLVGVERGLAAGGGARGGAAADEAPAEEEVAAFLAELERRVEAIP